MGVESCTACPLYETATQAVPGVGPQPAEYFFVAEAPGEREDAIGIPLVGKSGQLFDKLLLAAGLSREQVYITNSVKHRPPANRTPYAKERKACLPHLLAELEATQPSVIVAMGAVAINTFMKLSLKGEHGKARSIEFNGHDYTLVPWYHPAASFRNPNLLPLMVNDAERLQKEVSRESAGSIGHVDYSLLSEGLGTDRLLSKWGEVGFDVETTSPVLGKSVFQTDAAEIVGYSFSQASGSGWYSSLDERGRLHRGVAGALETGQWIKIVHEAKFEYKQLKRYGLTLFPFEDTKLAASLLGEHSAHLKDLARQYLGVDPTRITDLWKSKKEMYTADWETARDTYAGDYEYGSADSDYALSLWPGLKERLHKEGLWNLYQIVEKPLVPVLAEMELVGVQLDVEAAQELLEELKGLIKWAAETAQSAAGEEFKVSSRKQLATVLEAHGAPITARTATGQLKTDANTLKSLKGWWPEFTEPVLEFFKLDKLKGFVQSWLALAWEDGKIHTSINQTGTWEEGSNATKAAPGTGRLSSSGPNLNQVPHHSDEQWGARLRRLIIAPTGWRLVAADLEQEEPRLIVKVAGDEELGRAFDDGRDIYRIPTEALYPHTIGSLSDADWKEAFEHERFNGKTFFLAWYYGAGPGTLQKIDSSLSSTTAVAAVQALSRAHPARQDYIRRVEQEVAEANGVVVDFFGRKRWLPGSLAPKRSATYKEAIRQAANFKVQGPAATILKRAMVDIHRQFAGLEAQLLFPVHDEVVLQCPSTELMRVKGIVQSAFQKFGIPLPVSVQAGKNWAEMVVI